MFNKKNWRISPLWNKRYYKLLIDLFVATDFRAPTRGIHSYIVMIL